jgi:hypothetical protein
MAGSGGSIRTRRFVATVGLLLPMTRLTSVPVASSARTSTQMYGCAASMRSCRWILVCSSASPAARTAAPAARSAALADCRLKYTATAAMSAAAIATRVPASTVKCSHSPERRDARLSAGSGRAGRRWSAGGSRSPAASSRYAHFPHLFWPGNRSCVLLAWMGDGVRPDWWNYPVACGHGHPWGPGRVIVSWMPVRVRFGQGGAGAGARSSDGGVLGGWLPVGVVPAAVRAPRLVQGNYHFNAEVNAGELLL